jgi:hypothetical protein
MGERIRMRRKFPDLFINSGTSLKFCIHSCKIKRETLVGTQFLTHVLIFFQKNPKIEKNIENPKKILF